MEQLGVSRAKALDGCGSLLGQGTGNKGGNNLREGCLPCLGPAQYSGFPSAGYTAPYLTVFSENSIDVFDVRRTEWVQTVPLKKVKACPDPQGPAAVGWGSMASPLCLLSQVRPLNPEGSLFLYGTEKVRLTYLRNRLAGEGARGPGRVCTLGCDHLHSCGCDSEGQLPGSVNS